MRMADEEPEKKTYKIVYHNEDVLILFRDRSAEKEEE